MSLKRFNFDRNIEICKTCMFIDVFDEVTQTIIENPNDISKIK
jgi:hypothetical protein